ncbi:HipA N-terminal domain-containing protein [Pontibacter chinhatensis]|uniref:Serine/threonine-protein kinase HipA n=1 Tax=Pontibacter chinhatensis TaxID=1436961 RepID=A0A1I2Z2R7_9BACT|nr:HipA N-terminal domain-containing protein [Pontibacter chinhatensis]SFH31796.1 serine/threonine-protein kinase HipA [Pontibacter chinhatensis]
MRKAKINIHNKTAGWLTWDKKGYHFVYIPSYLQSTAPEPVSLTLPLQEALFTNRIMFPFLTD